MTNHWNLRQLSRALDADERLVGKAVAMLPTVTIDGRTCYPLDEAIPAILRRKWGLDQADDPNKLQPWDRLHHYRAERERLAVARAASGMIPQADAVAAAAAVDEAMSQALAVLAEQLRAELPVDAHAITDRLLAGALAAFGDGMDKLR